MSHVTKRLLGLLRPQVGQVAVSVLCRIVNQSLGVAIPAVAVALVFAVVEGTTTVPRALLALSGLAVIKGVFRYLEQYTGHAVAFRLLAQLRNLVFRWLERVETSRLEDERSGDLVARVSGDIDRVEPFYAHTIAPLVAAFVVPVLTVVATAWVVDAGVAWVLTLFTFSYLAVVPWIGKREVAEIGSRMRALSGETAAAVADTVQGARELAILEAGERVVGAIGELGIARASYAAALSERAAFRSFLGGLVSAGAVVATALVAIGSDLGLVEAAVAIVLSWTFMTPLRALEQIMPDTEEGLAAAARLFEIADMPVQPTGVSALSDDIGEVRFEAVSVRAGSATLVDGVDLVVPAGAFVGIVGPSGSGKSTLVQTLARHRDPVSGRALIDGVAVTEISPPSLAHAVALVPQRPDVFHGSIADNLRLARADASTEELMAALERAHLRDWVECLADGLDTTVGERGFGLSGGQMQRLALARVFLRDPAVIALDEATSELDPVSERMVLGEILAERGRRTLLVVAHRMETVISADQIVVMDRGTIVETGTHDELTAADRLYAALWRRHEDMLAG